MNREELKEFQAFLEPHDHESEMTEKELEDSLMDGLISAVFSGTKSWENMGDYEFSEQGMRDLLTPGEVAELVTAIKDMHSFTPDEKKG